MSHKLNDDLSEMHKTLKDYVEKGITLDPGENHAYERPFVVKPSLADIMLLNRVENHPLQFFAVDCSTRTLKRASHWGIYLLRVALTTVHSTGVDWKYNERVTTIIGDRRRRASYLASLRSKLESEAAQDLLQKTLNDSTFGSESFTNTPNKGDYILLDGAGFFGGERGFDTVLYERAVHKGINLLTISKQSTTFCDNKGRDLMSTVNELAPFPIWAYYPVKKANKEEHLYGDVSLVKLSEESPRIFRCDIMGHYNRSEIPNLLSPLTSISEDPRCVGYPIALWLAHRFSVPSNAKLYFYHKQIEDILNEAGLLNRLRAEELAINFAEELHGARYPFMLEWIDHA